MPSSVPAPLWSGPSFASSCAAGDPRVFRLANPLRLVGLVLVRAAPETTNSAQIASG